MMAVYESVGYCPQNIFFLKENEMGQNPTWERNKKILGSCIEYMVYAKCRNFFVEPLVFDLFIKSELGIEIAVLLREYFPEKTGKQILLMDLNNIGHIPDNAKRYHSRDYLVGMINDTDIIHVYIYKK